MQVHLRAARSSDLPVFFAHQCDADAADIVGFTPRTRAAFDEHWQRIITEQGVTLRTVEVDGQVAGYVCAFSRDGRPEIAYWFGREHWGKGVGRRAVLDFLETHRERPIFASVAIRNVASLAILRRCGFEFVAEEPGPDSLPEHLLRLD